MNSSALHNLASKLGVTLHTAPTLRVVPDQPSAPRTQRPTSAVDMIGQERVRVQLLKHLVGARRRNEVPGHILFHGPAGLGKTSLAEIVAWENGPITDDGQRVPANLIRVTASSVNGPKNLARQLAKLEEGDVLFIDEIHGLTKLSEEMLYTAMEDGRIEFLAGSGTKSETVSLDLALFTLVGATTQLGRVSEPLRDRFALVAQLEYYTPDELAHIVTRAADSQHTAITPDAAASLGRRSRGVPRVALNLYAKARDHACVMADGTVTEQMVDETMAVEDIDALGLTLTDQMLLLALCVDFKGGPTGIDNLSCAAGIEHATVRDVVEPFLVRLKFMARLPRGRVATKAAYAHLGLKAPADIGW